MSPRRGHREAVTQLVTSRAGPYRAGQCPGTGRADARLRPAGQWEGQGQGRRRRMRGRKIRHLIRSAELESVERRMLQIRLRCCMNRKQTFECLGLKYLLLSNNILRREIK